MSDESGDTDETRRRTRRRRFLALAAAGATTGLAGCGGGGGEEESPTDEPSPTATEGGGTGTPESVPAEYETATAQDGSQRNPDGLSSKASVQYQAQPNEGQQCSGCRFYIPDKNGDGLGACSIVAGTIDPEGWCVSYAPLPTDTESG